MTGPPEIAGEDELHAFVDGRLDGEARRAFEARLSTDRDAAQRVEDYRRQSETLRRHLAPVADEPVPIRLSLVKLGTSAPPRWKGLGGFQPASFVAGLLCGMLVVGAAWMALPREPVVARIDPIETTARRALVAHRLFSAEARHPVEVRAGESHLVPWLTRRTSVPVVLPDLEREGYALIGGRLLPSESGGTAALLMFEREGTRVTLYATREGAPTSAPARYIESGGNGAVHWAVRGVSYVLAGPADRDRLSRLADLVGESLDKSATKS